MDLDRGTLARLDRTLLAGLGRDETFRMVRVPVTAAKWSTWKRYCDSAGISMGRAIMALIEHELASVVAEASDDGIPVFAADAEARLADREARIGERERALDAEEARLREWTSRLRLREDELRSLERRVKLMAKTAVEPVESGPKVGRNQACPCGSGLKYKYCHGRAGRSSNGCVE